jgi:hypothetical protein
MWKHYITFRCSIVVLFGADSIRRSLGEPKIHTYGQTHSIKIYRQKGFGLDFHILLLGLL